MYPPMSPAPSVWVSRPGAPASPRQSPLPPSSVSEQEVKVARHSASAAPLPASEQFRKLHMQSTEHTG